MKRFLSLCIAAIAAVAICSAQDISPNVTVKDLSGNNVLMKDVLTVADRTVLQKLGNDCLTF